MAVGMRRSSKRDLIASKRLLRNPQTIEEQPVCAMCGGRKEDALSDLNQTKLHVERTHSML
jgi:hypothetical protein